jgi:glycosyltransferase involved in cell wall biosynthesis
LPSVSLCFPVWNEESTVARVLEEAHALASEAGLDFELIVCDDGSTDATYAAIQQVAVRIPDLQVLRHDTNEGIRATFEHLYSVSRKEFVFLNSTDGQWDTRILLDMLPRTCEWDVIIASRRRKPYRPVRHVISWGFNVIPLLLFGVRTVDAGAVKLQQREIIERFRLVSRSPFTEAERIVRARRAGYTYTYFPIEGMPRTSGRERGADWKSVRDGLLDVPRVWWAINVADRRAAREAGRGQALPRGRRALPTPPTAAD